MNSLQVRRLTGFLIIAAAALCVVALPTSADVIEKLDTAKLRTRAETIVRASVGQVTSRWTTDHSFIFTFVTLHVLETYKGRAPSTLQVRVPGGRVGAYQISAHSMPEFRSGEEIVVFLTRWQDGAYKVAGYHQGLSNVVPSASGRILRGGALDRRALHEVEPLLRPEASGTSK